MLRSLGGLLRRSKQDTDKNDTLSQESQAQKDGDPVEPSADPASVDGTLIVSPEFAQDIMSDPPDQSVEEIASEVNTMALRDVSKSSPKTSVSGKRKRQAADVVEQPSKKRILKDGDTTRCRDEPPATFTNDPTSREGGSNRAFLEAVQVVPRKLTRPSKAQMPRHFVEQQPVSQKSDNIYDFGTCGEEQVENSASVPTPGAVASTETTPRRRGRPPGATRKTTSTNTGQKKKSQEHQVKPEGKRRSEKRVGLETETQEQSEEPAESLPQRMGPKTRSKASRANPGDETMARAQSSKSTRSTAAANGCKGVRSNTNTKEIALHAGDEDNVARARAKKASKRVGKDDLANVEVGQNRQNQGIDAQHGGEQGEEDDSGSEGSKGSQETLDKGTQMDEAAEGRAEVGGDNDDVEAPVEVSESEESEDGEEGLELFGQHKAWTTVLKGARSVCGVKLPLNHMPKLLTARMRDLVQKVVEARKLYGQLSPFQELDHDSHDGLNEELRERLDAIEGQIQTLSEKTAAREGREMIRDIFACAIPAMVFLLRSALVSRVYHVNEPCDLATLNEIVASLKEIIRLQKMTISLCEKARNWEAEPVPTTRPIKSSTTRQILPSLRGITDAFSRVLLEQNRKRKMKQNTVDYMLRQRESRQTKQEVARQDEIWLRKIRESREQQDQRRRNGKRTFRQVIEDEARARTGSLHVNGHIESRVTWSDAEDLALYFQLEKGYAGHVTSTERYLDILNTDLLQNKLPEHIRERALYFKPFLLEQRGALEWISSIE